IINLNYGGLGRLATFLSGFFMLLSVVLLNGSVVQIPVVALAAVMVVVSIETINWDSIKRLRTNPKNESFAMILTVAIVIGTHNLAYGVVAGTLVSAVFAAFKMSHLHVATGTADDDHHYKVDGHLYFASAEKFLDFFAEEIEQEEEIVIDISAMTLWDSTAVEAIDKLITRNNKRGVKTTLTGANTQSSALFKRISIHTEK
ncbi:MAG: STAS domain-containing protein, partial [Trichococcus flocculiformis]